MNDKLSYEVFYQSIDKILKEKDNQKDKSILESEYYVGQTQKNKRSVENYNRVALARFLVKFSTTHQNAKPTLTEKEKN